MEIGVIAIPSTLRLKFTPCLAPRRGIGWNLVRRTYLSFVARTRGERPLGIQKFHRFLELLIPFKLISATQTYDCVAWFCRKVPGETEKHSAVGVIALDRR